MRLSASLIAKGVGKPPSFRQEVEDGRCAIFAAGSAMSNRPASPRLTAMWGVGIVTAKAFFD